VPLCCPKVHHGLPAYNMKLCLELCYATRSAVVREMDSKFTSEQKQNDYSIGHDIMRLSLE
jgi:hypothetical protein